MLTDSWQWHRQHAVFTEHLVGLCSLHQYEARSKCLLLCTQRTKTCCSSRSVHMEHLIWHFVHLTWRFLDFYSSSLYLNGNFALYLYLYLDLYISIYLSLYMCECECERGWFLWPVLRWTQVQRSSKRSQPHRLGAQLLTGCWLSSCKANTTLSVFFHAK